jgi:hypothetical protein
MPQVSMRRTPFPARPCDVAPLTVAEFTFGLDPGAAVSVDLIGRRFTGDANRALVWLIRFRALAAWCVRADVAAWVKSGPSHVQHACEMAAAFELNEDWEFDAEAFRSAVESA